LDFLKLTIHVTEELKAHLKLFLKEWRNFYPDQLKTQANNIAYTKKISMLEAIKQLEDEIIEQFNNLVDTLLYVKRNPGKRFIYWTKLKSMSSFF